MKERRALSIYPYFQVVIFMITNPLTKPIAKDIFQNHASSLGIFRIYIWLYLLVGPLSLIYNAFNFILFVINIILMLISHEHYYKYVTRLRFVQSHR